MNEMNDIDVKKLLGTALRDLRESRNLTQEQLAEKLNLKTYQTINRIENGKSFLTSQLLEDMCKFFQVPPHYFFIASKALRKENTDYMNQIKLLLSSLSKDRLKDVYNIIVTFLK